MCGRDEEGRQVGVYLFKAVGHNRVLVDWIPTVDHPRMAPCEAGSVYELNKQTKNLDRQDSILLFFPPFCLGLSAI